MVNLPMLVIYYDNLEATLSDNGTDLIAVERVYCLDWHRFQESHWKDLSDIYASLPGAVRYFDIPWWFGETEESPPFLWASVEPPGLQVCGALSKADWLAWDQQFRSAARNLPMYVLE